MTTISVTLTPAEANRIFQALAAETTRLEAAARTAQFHAGRANATDGSAAIHREAGRALERAAQATSALCDDFAVIASHTDPEAARLVADGGMLPDNRPLPPRATITPAA